MRKDHRPYFLKNMNLQFEGWFSRHFLLPQLERMGRDCRFIKPWHIKIFGSPIEIGNYVTMIASPDRLIHLCVWPKRSGEGRISIGDYSIISPGVRISSAENIEIGKSSMLASGVYITDANWHGIYDRISFGETASVRIGDNVWIGDSAIVLKGVTIGRNSIVGAGSVVTRSIPENVIAAGNPASVVRKLTCSHLITTREDFFSNGRGISDQLVLWDQANLIGNSLWGWVRHLLFPTKKS